MKGYELYRAYCAQCHAGPLFTDHDYHNVGYGGKVGEPNPDVETGRSVRVPTGLKETRLIGAFRTPTLRNLLVTNPYFHDGSRTTLREVVEFYDNGFFNSPYLAQCLRSATGARVLNLTGANRTLC